ncbi:MAG: Ig-like domain-containing protein [Oscillospiraceae bacterium]|nr:Ig-like domain-containing protein [Oscillospiraceae bacterium]
MKKLLAATLAAGMTATALFSTSAFSAIAADAVLKFDISSKGSNEVKISAADIAAGDITVPVDISIPENPGVGGINLKFQVNDGEVKEDGSFGNYGLYMADAAFANPYCFDSAQSGDPTKALTASFNSKLMNLVWVYSEDYSKDADAAKQAGTTSWDSSAEFASSAIFAKANIVVPKNTKAGTYKLDIRTDEYINSCDASSKSKSTCYGSASETALSFTSVPLNIVVEDAPTTPPSGDPWKKDYSTATDKQYIVIGSVSARPGESIKVPVYVYHDQGTSGVQLNFGYDKTAMKLAGYSDSEDNYAYLADPEANKDLYPATWAFAQGPLETAKDGSILTYLDFEVSETAKAGSFPVTFEEKGYEGRKIKIVGKEASVAMDVALIDGCVTVVTDDSVQISRDKVQTDKKGDVISLNLIGATGDVTWASSDEKVATVDKNGFVTTVSDEGTATITATCGDKEYKCEITIGEQASDDLFGDAKKDGVIDLGDAQITLKSVVSYMGQAGHTLPEDRLKVANVKYDPATDAALTLEKQVDLGDVQCILKYATQIQGGLTPSWYEITNNPNAPDAPKA